MFPLYYTGLGSRKNNQDYYFSLINNDNLILGVADGVGGNSGGDIASKLAIQKFSDDFINCLNTYSIKDSLERSFNTAHAAINEYSIQYPEYFNMATTLSVCYIVKDRLYVAHSGDSRVYIMRRKGIKQLTIDDTEVNKLIKEGLLRKEDAESYPRKNILTNALGIKSDFTVQTEEYELQPYDRILLLTDGFYQNISKQKLRDLSIDNEEFSNLFFEAVSFCSSSHPNDNFTLVGVEIN